MTGIETNASEFLKGHLSARDSARLEAIRSNDVLKFVSEYIPLCNPASVYVSASTHEDLEFVRDAAVADGEESHFRSMAIQPTSKATMTRAETVSTPRY